MTGFALYRLPYGRQAVLVAQDKDEPWALSSWEHLNSSSGFLIAPFARSATHPAILIRPDIIRKTVTKDVSLLYGELYDCLRENGESCGLSFGTPANRHDYTSDFAQFHARLAAGDFRKIVLSRCETLPREDDRGPLDLFRQACEHYPRLFIALVCTPQSGIWLSATPEVMLEGGEDGRWRTIALAGTMKLEGDDLHGEGESAAWSTKDIQEQRYVATYLHDSLKDFSSDICEEGPRTVRAANLVHLRTDFTFSLGKTPDIGLLLQRLHPTPAVCGLPKAETLTFIAENEHTPRHYYSGFMGPLQLPHESQPSPLTTHLYVSLRCMHIARDCYHLYAGGGLLADSHEEQEWKETEAKMDTMRSLLYPQAPDYKQ